MIFEPATGFTGASIQNKAKIYITLLRDIWSLNFEGILRDFDIRLCKEGEDPHMLPIAVVTFTPQLRPSPSTFDPDEEDVETHPGRRLRCLWAAGSPALSTGRLVRQMATLDTRFMNC
jgi:hypothetical protein